MFRRPTPATIIASAALFFSLAGATVARATVLVGPRSEPIGGQWQRWMNRSLEPTPRGRVAVRLFVPKPCRPAVGCFNPGDSIIYVEKGASDARFALMHEIGHLFDRRYLDRRERQRFEYLDGWDHGDGYGYVPWSTDTARPWEPDGGDPPGTPIEDFANTYASCAIYGLHPTVWYMNDWQGWDCSWANYRAACALIRRAIGS